MVIPVGLKHIFTHRLFVEFPTYLIKLSHMLSVNFRIKKKTKKKKKTNFLTPFSNRQEWDPLVQTTHRRVSMIQAKNPIIDRVARKVFK